MKWGKTTSFGRRKTLSNTFPLLLLPSCSEKEHLSIYLQEVTNYMNSSRLATKFMNMGNDLTTGFWSPTP